MKRRDLYEIKSYSPLVILNKLKEEKINIYDFKKKSDFVYNFYADSKDEKKLKKLFKDVKIVQRSFFKGLVYSLIKKRTTLISIIFSIVLFCFASTRLYRLSINGSSKEIDQRIIEHLRDNGIYRFSSIPSTNKLKSMEEELSKVLMDDVERIEIVREGLTISITYEKRRSAIILPSLQKNLIAKRKGVIESFIIEYGNPLVHVGELVQEGQILVSEDFNINEEESIKTFTLGKVYAYTWYDINVSTRSVGDKSEDISNLILLADSMVLTKEKKLDKRELLSFKSNSNMAEGSFHYTVLENIAISD